ncbi:MAG: RDD family protein [Pseudomonadota bacterium]|nr:RDD family protein [Pseudomonadota bacterium]MEE3295743.1 RDD family protein [Pseudomonadota bacterium]
MNNINISYYEKILLKRMIASFIDVLLVSILTFTVLIIISFLSVLTLGIIGKSVPFVIPVIFSSYFSFTLGGDHSATPGMKILGIVLKIRKKTKLSKVSAFGHTLIFFMSLPIGLIFLISILYPLLNKQRKCIHDLIYEIEAYEKKERKDDL